MRAIAAGKQDGTSDGRGQARGPRAPLHTDELHRPHRLRTAGEDTEEKDRSCNADEVHC